MTQGDALYAAILAQPGDDTPRLVYADWLEGDADPPQPERAEFVRVQVEIERRCWGPYGKRELYSPEELPIVNHLYHRESALLTLDRSLEWFGASVRNEDLFTHDFRRGFVWRVECSWRDWLANAGRIIAAQPVESVVLESAPFLGHILVERWPHIRFEVRTATTERGDTQYDDAAEELEDDLGVNRIL